MFQKIGAFFMSIIMAVLAFFGIGGKPPVQKGKWTVDRAAIIALAEEEGLEIVVQDCNLVPQPGGTPSTREFTGIRIRDLLTYYNVKVDKLGDDAYLVVASSDADNFSTDYDAALIKSQTTLIAWKEDKKDGSGPQDVLRTCVKGGPAYQFVKNVETLTLFD